MKPFKNGPITKSGSESKLIVLYVEDEEENRRVAKLRLENDYELLLASSSREACNLIRAKTKDIGAILMDIELQGSELDGIMLTRLVRGTLVLDDMPSYAQNFPVLEIPIIFVTAYGNRYKEEDLKEFGADGLIHKPVDFVQLTMALTQIRLEYNKKILSKPSQLKGAVEVENNEEISKRKTTLRSQTPENILKSDKRERQTILYVGEEGKDWILTKARLGINYQIEFAGTARETCQVLTRRGEEFQAVIIDELFVDQELDLRGITRLIGESPRGLGLPPWAYGVPKLGIPVFVLGNDKDRYKWRDSDAAGMLNKPIEKSEFEDLLNRAKIRKEFLTRKKSSLNPWKKQE